MRRPNPRILAVTFLLALLTPPLLPGRSALADLGAAAEVYYPLDQGYSWNYEIVITEFGKDRPPAYERITNLTRMRINSEDVTPRRAESPGGVSFLVAAREDGVCLIGARPHSQGVPTLLDEPDYLIKEPIEVGSTWTTKVITMTIEAIGESVTVPACDFDGCLKIKRAETVEGQFMGPGARRSSNRKATSGTRPASASSSPREPAATQHGPRRNSHLEPASGRGTLGKLHAPKTDKDTRLTLTLNRKNAAGNGKGNDRGFLRCCSSSLFRESEKKKQKERKR